MKSYITLGSVLLLAFAPIGLADLTHSAGDILYRRTNDLPGADFTGALPENVDLEAPAGELDDPDSFIIEAIDVDREPGNGGIDLSGDHHHLAFTFQFYDADGAFSFTENYDDRVQVTITPITGSTDLTETAAAVVHQNTGWNQRSNAVYDFGSGGWFDARIIMTEDGGGAQSAADIGFGYNRDGSNGGPADFGGIGYLPAFGASAGQAVFDTDGNGESYGSAIETEAGPGPDSDGDGIDDSYEEQFFPGDLTQLGPGDFDGDGVNDPVEFADGTDPTVVDSDGDGSSDGEEKANGTDPLAEDSDNDGLPDGVESDSGVFDGPDDTGTDPLDSDTDDDGLLDGVETNTTVFNGPTDTGTDPLDPDTDGDTFTDGDEVSVGFDPNDEDSHPRAPLAPSGALHLPESILYRRTDGLPGADFTGELPLNIDEEEPRGEIDAPDTSIIPAIDVDREPGNGGIDLTGDHHDLAFTFQFYDTDGTFTFTENYDDRVQVTVTPIASARDLTGTAAPVVHQNTGWNQRSFASYNFGSGGWFDARILMSEDGGGAQSAADIGFGFNATGSNGGAGDFGGIGYVPGFGASAGQAVFDTDANGDSWGSLIIVPESIDAYQFKVSSPDGGVNLEFSWNSFASQEYSIVSTNDLAANPNSSTWSVVPGLAGIAATPPRNVISIPKPLDPVRFYKLIGGPIPPLFFDDFESGQGGWTTREDDQMRNTLWELGIPSGTTGPLSGAGNSANAWSTNLGDYGPNSDISLRSPAINLGNVPSAQVTFDVYRDADGFADTAVVRFLRAADEVQLGPEIAMDMTIFDLDWVTLNIAVVPEAIGENVIIEWNFVSDGSLDSFSGLSIDNVGVDAD
ncbi:MAG: hypothetical protein QF706_12525 [Roseibacillus sp.]|nr:hypothetical protein [Roseibacillus sp.]